MTHWPDEAAPRAEQGDDQLPGHAAGVRLADMDDPAAGLAAYFQARTPVPDQELIQLTSAARAGGHSWASIAAACQVRRRQDTQRIVFGPGGTTPHTGAGLLYQATQSAVERVAGRRYPPLTWHCADCGQRVTDRAGAGRPIHIEHGHATGCRRLRRDQAARSASPGCSSEPGIAHRRGLRLPGRNAINRLVGAVLIEPKRRRDPIPAATWASTSWPKLAAPPPPTTGRRCTRSGR